MKKTLRQALSVGKLILGLTLLAALLIWDDNAQHLWRIIQAISLQWIVVLMLFGMALNWISCLKWRMFVIARGFSVSVSRLFCLYLVGKFFSNFMPSMIGGDITRTYLLGRQINSQSQSFASVFLERFTGLIALTSLAILFSLVNHDLVREPKIGFAIASVSLAFFICTGILLKPEIIDWAGAKVRSLPVLPAIFATIRKFQCDILFFRRKYRVLAGAMAYSFGFHLMTSVLVYLCCLAIDFHPSFLDVAVITPVILLLNTIPVSPNNIGWWEWTFSFLLVEAGAGPAEGLAVGLILRALTLFSSMVGGALFLVEKYGKHEVITDCHETGSRRNAGA